MRINIRPVSAPDITGVTASSGIRLVTLRWTVPATNVDHAKTEIWWSNVNNRAGATKIGEAAANVFVHNNADPAQVHYYWLRSVNGYGRADGNWTAAVSATPLQAGQYDIQAGAIKTSHMSADYVYAGRISVEQLDAGVITATVSINSNGYIRASGSNTTGNSEAGAASVFGNANGTATGVFGHSGTGMGVFGLTAGGSSPGTKPIGVRGVATGGIYGVGVQGESVTGYGVIGITSNGRGVYGESLSTGYAIYSNGPAYVSGPLTVTGTINGTVSYASSAGSASTAGTATNASYATTAGNSISTSSLSGGRCLAATSNSGETAGTFTNYGSGKELLCAGGSHAAYAFAGKGKIYAADGFTAFTGAHESLIDKNSAWEPGDIVIDKAIIHAPDVNNATSEIELSFVPCQKGAFGVITESRPLDQYVLVGYADWWHYEPTHLVATVNGVGEGKINVCGEAGAIEKGDLIVTSSMPGKGMRQSDDLVRSYTVARARESVQFDDPTQVRQIACVYLCG